MKVHPALVWLFRLILAGLFLLAAVGKILNPADFAAVIRKFHVLPRLLSNFPAIVLPWIEALAALSLIFGPWRRAAALWLGLLLSGFLLLFVWAMILGIDVDCGCFGDLGSYMALLAGKVGPLSILRNLLLIGMAWLLFRQESDANTARH
jgi:uncharacterized membrane protein YphA (DoxX/SURF4 family)